MADDEKIELTKQDVIGLFDVIKNHQTALASITERLKTNEELLIKIKEKVEFVDYLIETNNLYCVKENLSILKQYLESSGSELHKQMNIELPDVNLH